jgi:hypothetical protein
MAFVVPTMAGFAERADFTRVVSVQPVPAN